MNIQELHRTAMRLSKEATVDLEQGNVVQYSNKLLQAYSLEKQVAESLKDRHDIEPTRSVLYRSAATLAFKCERYDESYQLISDALNGNPFDEIKNELLDLLIDITATNHVKE